MLRQSSLAAMAKAPCVVTTQYLLIKEDCKSLSRAKLFAEVAATLAVNPGSSGDRAPSQQTNEHAQGCRKLPSNAKYKARIAETLRIGTQGRNHLIRECTHSESQSRLVSTSKAEATSQTAPLRYRFVNAASYKAAVIEGSVVRKLVSTPEERENFKHEMNLLVRLHHYNSTGRFQNVHFPLKYDAEPEKEPAFVDYPLHKGSSLEEYIRAIHLKSAQGELSASAATVSGQEQVNETATPALTQEELNETATPALTQDELNETATPALTQDELNKTATPALTQDELNETAVSARHSLDETAAIILAQVLVTLDHLHCYVPPDTTIHKPGRKLYPIVHADIRPGNLLLLRPGDITSLKVTNFSQARQLQMTVNDFALSRWEYEVYSKTDLAGDSDRNDNFEFQPPVGSEYWAPERLDNGVVTPKTDIWSCGIILGQILGRLDSRGRSFIKQVEAFHRETPWSSMPESGADNLLKGMLSIDPNSRPDARDCLTHPFIQMYAGSVLARQSKRKPCLANPLASRPSGLRARFVFTGKW